MNPLFEKSGLTPTAAIAMRANAQEQMFALRAKMKADQEAAGMPNGFDLKVAMPMPVKLAANGQPAAVVRKWPK